MICKTALAAEPGGMTTRALAVACLGARGFDHEDPVLVRAMVGVLGQHAEDGGEARGGSDQMGESERKAIWRRP